MEEGLATVMAMATAIATTMALLIAMVILMDIPIDIPIDTPPNLVGRIIMGEIIIMNQGIDPVISVEIKG
jgi:hypothetical protein